MSASDAVLLLLTEDDQENDVGFYCHPYGQLPCDRIQLENDL
jgi:hypothetical protein